MPFVAKRAFDWEPALITPEWGLRDVPAGHAYALCNSVHCESCGFLFLDIRFDESEMRALYDDYRGETYVALRERFEPGYLARNEALARESAFLPVVERFLAGHVRDAPRILDWGGDNGLNTPLRRDAALHHVLDISGKDVVEGASRVVEGEIDGYDYDLVVLRHVLEHIPFPMDVLLAAAPAVRNGTTLYIEVPHEELMRAHHDDASLERRKRYWHEHVNFYSPRALEVLLERAGYVVTALASLDVSTPERPYHVLAVVATRPPE